MDEYFKLRNQLRVLREIQHDYSGKTIENIIKNLEAIVAYKESLLDY